MTIERFIVSGGDNYNYLLVGSNGGAVAVDPLENETVLSLAKKHNATITHILITHGHYDHTGGATELAKATGAAIVGHKTISIVTEPMSHNETRQFGGITVTALETPGHTFDSICYHSEEVLFTGDTIFFSGAGNCHSGDPEKLFESFSGILAKLSDATALYVGHEYAKRNLEFAASIEPDNPAIEKRLSVVASETTPLSTIGDERTYNPFFRFADESFHAALGHTIGKEIKDSKEAFLQTRELRNNW